MEQLNQIIQTYLQTPNTDYAIMINGEWGCGKTYYIQHELQSLVKSIPYTNHCTPQTDGIQNMHPSETFQPIYISLYGLSSSDDFYMKVFAGLNTWTTNKWVGMIGLAVSKGLRSQGVEFEGKDLHSITRLPDNALLIFDDLERIETNKISIQETLALLNTYIEHNNVKSIIVCNEQYYKDDRNYLSYKEKCIRFTHTYKTDVFSVYDQFISSQSNDKYREFLGNYKEYILSVFEVGGKKNLRTLKFFIDIFYPIFLEVNQEDKYTKVLFKKILYVFLVYAMEYKDGHNIDEIKALKQYFDIDLTSWGLEGDDTTSKPHEKTYSECVEEKYGTQYSEEMSFYPFLVDYLYTGYLDVVQLHQIIVDLINTINKLEETPEGRIYSKLKSYATLEDDVINSYWEELLEYVKNNKYNLYELLNIYSLLVNYDAFHIFTITDAIKQDFIKAMDNALTNHVYSSHFALQTPEWISSDSEPYKKYMEIKEYAIELNRKSQILRFTIEQNNFLDIIERGDIEELRNYKEISIKKISLCDIDWQRIINVLETKSNPFVCELIDYILISLNENKLYSQDITDASKSKLQEWIKQYQNNEYPRIRTMYILELQKRIESILQS